ncbi:MAG: TolC family protein [Deltaproteobacteria bacterium]|nr:TolC family protein [Deltaproteobacteria bacterium]
MERHLAFRAVLFTLHIFLVITIAIVRVNAGNQKRSGGTLELEVLISEALERNPEIIAARNRWLSAQEIVRARRSFPDPRFSYTYFVESVETRVGPQKNIFGAKQTFPFYGKRDLRANVAAKQAESLKESYQAGKSEVIRQVKRSFYDLFYVSTIIDITHREKELLKRFEHIAMTKYATGGGSQQDILKVQVEISKLQDRLLTLSDHKQTAEAILNILVNRPVDRPLGKPQTPKLRKFFYRQEELFTLAKENRPELHEAKALIEKSESAYKLAKKKYYPDLTIGVNYIQVDSGPLNVSDNGKDAFAVTTSINIPIWFNKLSSQVKSAGERIRAQESAHQNVLNRTLFEVKDNYFRIQTARDTVDLYKAVLIPQAEQSMKSAEAGYISGIVSFLDLLDAERILLRIQVDYWKAYAAYLKRITDIERAVGVELPEYPPVEFIPEIKEE